MKEIENTIHSKIWMEEASADNPFFAEKSYCHGYDFYNDLLGKVGWMDLLFLHLTGELPDKKEKEHFSLLMAAVMNPGPRDLQNRAAMSAAAGGCYTGTALMAGLTCAQGALQGGMAVEQTMNMLLEIDNKNIRFDETMDFDDFFGQYINEGFLPGYGKKYGERDIHAGRLIEIINEKECAGSFLNLAVKMEKVVSVHRNEWLMLYGVFAASMLDLGLSAVKAHGLFMIAGSAGMLAHLCERYDEHWTEYPTWFTKGSYCYNGE